MRGGQGQESAGLSRRAPHATRYALLSRRSSLLLGYLMIVYGVAMIVATLALWYLLVPTSGPAPPSPVPCALGPPPAGHSGLDASLASRPTAFPVPANGTSTPESFVLWVNTTARMLPGTNVSFAVRDLVGVPSAPSCLLPIPRSAWAPNASSLSVFPLRNYTVSFEGAPAPPSTYVRSGAFSVQVWVNATNAPGASSTNVYLNVG